MTLLRNCFIKAGLPIGKRGFQASDRLLKKRLAVRLTTPVISGLTAPQRFVFSPFLVPALGGSGAALSEVEGIASGQKAITDQSVAPPPVDPNSPKGAVCRIVANFGEDAGSLASWDIGCAD
jgi:hypothetical protein